MDEKIIHSLKTELLNFNIEDRKTIILEDLQIGKFRILANDNPIEFFKLLGGELENFDEKSLRNWARPYSYEQYIKEFNLEFNQYDFENYDIEKESIIDAFEYVYWIKTVDFKLYVDQNNYLEFIGELFSGKITSILKTPYDDKMREIDGWFNF